MNALVMYDHQTRTLWSQFLGKGVEGELAGTDLTVLPVTTTSWAQWRELHADTLVLDKQGRYQSDSYMSYYVNNSAGVIGETFTDERLHRKELVLGVHSGGSARAYPYSTLRRLEIVNDVFLDEAILVFYDRASETALAFDRESDGRLLTFRVEGEAAGVQTILVDEETGSRWMAFTGRAFEGELSGNPLKRLTSLSSFWFAWKDWNPDTELYSG